MTNGQKKKTKMDCIS